MDDTSEIVCVELFDFYVFLLLDGSPNFCDVQLNADIFTAFLKILFDFNLRFQ